MSCFGSFHARDYDRREDQPAFMSCFIRVDTDKRGWPRSLNRVLRTIEVRTCIMNGNDEQVEVSGFGVPRVLVRAIGRSRRLKLEWLQYGQCSDYLYAPDRRQFQAPVVMTAAMPNGVGIGYPIRGGYYGQRYPSTYYYENENSCNVM